MYSLFLQLLFAFTFAFVAPAFAMDESTAEVQLSICDTRWAELSSRTRQFFNPESQALIVFYDTSDFSLHKNNIQLRKKTNMKKKTSQIVTKVRFSKASQIPDELIEDFKLNCEFDVYSSSQLYTCKHKEKANQPSFESLSLIENSKRDLDHVRLAKDLRELPALHYSEYTAKEEVLGELGLTELTLDFMTKDQIDFIELSTRVSYEKVPATLKKLSHWATAAGFSLCTQQTDRFSRLYPLK